MLNKLLSFWPKITCAGRKNLTAPEHRGASLEAFRAIQADSAQLLIVVIDAGNAVVATMQLTVIPGLPRMRATRLLVEALRVEHRLRGNGLSSAMMRWAIAEGKRRGVALVQLTNDQSRDAAHRFYERLGFTASHVGFKLFIEDHRSGINLGKPGDHSSRSGALSQ